MYPIINDPKKYSAALYVRLSKEDEHKKNADDDSESIKNQIELLQNYAAEQKLSVYDTYIDDGYSGTSHQRPNFERLIDDIYNKKVNLVITKDLSRLSRNYIDTGHFLEEVFPEENVRYISLLDGIDTFDKNYSGDITPFKAILNDMYAKDISKKISSVKHNKQLKGDFIGGKAPYGYIKSPTEKNKIVVDEYAAEIVKKIFNLALSGTSCRQIAMELNRENIPTPAQYANIKLSIKGPYSGKWSSERVSAMLQNEVYIGNMVQGRMVKVSYKSKKCKRLPPDEWIVVENTHEPIIDKETFKKVGELIKSRNNTRSRTYDFLLKGLIYCHECGYPLGVVKRNLSGNIPTMYFVCRTYQRFTEYHTCTCHCVRVEDVTSAVIDEIKKVCREYINNIDTKNLSNKATKEIQSLLRKQDRDIAALNSKLEFIQKKIDNAYMDKLSEIIDADTFNRIYQNLLDEQKSTRDRLTELNNSDFTAQIIDENKIKELVEEFINAKECSRELLISLVERIELTEDKQVKVFFKFKELKNPSHL